MASSTSSETPVAYPRSSQVQYSIEIPASSATSSRAQPRHPPVGA